MTVKDVPLYLSRQQEALIGMDRRPLGRLFPVHNMNPWG